MKQKNDPDMPIGKLTRVDDFLPPPEKLVMPDDTVKITIALKRTSIEFFKQEAKKNKVKYQKMIRNLLDSYAAKYAH
jgi:predicted DNA binding CopG/RHH family protein